MEESGGRAKLWKAILFVATDFADYVENCILARSNQLFQRVNTSPSWREMDVLETGRVACL